MPRPPAPAPWVASFVLRMFPFDPVARALAGHGLKTEKLDAAAFVQRRFKDREEFHQALRALEAAGVDPQGFESDGLMFAELFLSRPEESVSAAPLEQVITVTSGRNRRYGARFTRLETADGAARTVIR